MAYSLGCSWLTIVTASYVSSQTYRFIIELGSFIVCMSSSVSS